MSVYAELITSLISAKLDPIKNTRQREVATLPITSKFGWFLWNRRF